MENFVRNNNALYPNITDMKRCNQLMNTLIGSPFGTKSGGYYNPKLLMSSPYELYKCDDVENIDPQILMSMNSSLSSSDHNFSLPSAVNRVRHRGGHRSPLYFVENYGNSSSTSASKSSYVAVNTPLRMEDGVLVMDEVFVVNALDERSRSGKDSSGSSASSVQSNMMGVCSSWAETGSCRFDSNCQFSHSKEDPGLARFSNKGKPELEVGSSKITSSTYFEELTKPDFKGHNSMPAMSRGAVAFARYPQVSGRTGTIRGSPEDDSGSGDSRHCVTPKYNCSPMTCLDWMPQDDGINARPPGSQNPSRCEVLEYINSYLYAPRVKNRLSVFTAICPDFPCYSGNVQQNKP